MVVVMTMVMVACSSNLMLKAEESVDWSDVVNYYPYNSWAVETGTKYKLIFLENNRRETKRYEVANILYDILKPEKIEGTSVVFSDLSDMSAEYQKKITKMASIGIVSGYEDGTFRPYANVTRAEFAAMLERSGVLRGEKVAEVNFTDILDHWAAPSINKVAELGIVTGKGEGIFSPLDNITPQEILIILDRMEKAGDIAEEDVVKAITDTFKSKKYEKEEEYIIEVMYSQFDEVQQEIIYSWPWKDTYDPSSWEEYATYEDLMYAMLYTIKGAFYEYELNNPWVKDSPTKLDKLKEQMTEMLGSNIDWILNEKVTLKYLMLVVTFYNWDSIETVNRTA